jgi:hypothetical protein
VSMHMVVIVVMVMVVAMIMFVAMIMAMFMRMFTAFWVDYAESATFSASTGFTHGILFKYQK